MVELCIKCGKDLTRRSHIITCNTCGRWSHRKCNTGITFQLYLEFRRGATNIEWQCKDCQERVRNSTTIEKNVPAQMEFGVTLLDEVKDRGDEVPDISFDLSGKDSERPVVSLKGSLEEGQLDGDIPDDQPVTYEVVITGTKRGAAKLVASDGYTYTKGTKLGDRQYWRCSVRNKTTNCPASVKQFMGMYVPGFSGHIHAPDPGAAIKVKIATKVKEVAMERLFESASSIVERVMKETITSDHTNLPNPDNLSRAANRIRSTSRR